MFGQGKRLRQKDDFFDSAILLETTPPKLTADLSRERLFAVGIDPRQLEFENLQSLPPNRFQVTDGTFTLTVWGSDAPYLPAGVTMEGLIRGIKDRRLAENVEAHTAFILIHTDNKCPHGQRSFSSEMITRSAAQFISPTTLILWDANSNTLILPSDDALTFLRERQTGRGI